MSDAEKMILAQIKSKSLAVGVILTLFFGGFGTFYVSIIGGIICSAIELVLWVIIIFTAGFGIILALPMHIVFIIYTIISINAQNKKVLKGIIEQ